MCERTYCRHEHERLCSCPPVTCRDALGMAAHLAENMEQVQWRLTYNSLKDIKPYPDVVSVRQMCIMLGGISMKTAYKLLGNGEIHHLKIGKSFKIPKICVIEYLLG